MGDQTSSDVWSHAGRRACPDEPVIYPETGIWQSSELLYLFSTRIITGEVGARGAERRRGLGRRAAARATSGTLGAASAASCRRRSARRC